LPKCFKNILGINYINDVTLPGFYKIKVRVILIYVVMPTIWSKSIKLIIYTNEVIMPNLCKNIDMF